MFGFKVKVVLYHCNQHFSKAKNFYFIGICLCCIFHNFIVTHQAVVKPTTEDFGIGP